MRWGSEGMGEGLGGSWVGREGQRVCVVCREPAHRATSAAGAQG